MTNKQIHKKHITNALLFDGDGGETLSFTPDFAPSCPIDLFASYAARKLTSRRTLYAALITII